MKRLISTSLVFAFLAFPALATPLTPDEDEVVRLPGSGEVKSGEVREKLRAERLKPGGGLLASFDADGNNSISHNELESGIKAAFFNADANEDGNLTAIEQMDWANSLLTHDNSLANPVRFDPNLDRRVSYNEFRSVILGLASDYREDDAELRLASLKAPERDRREERREDLLQVGADGRYGPPVESDEW